VQWLRRSASSMLNGRLYSARHAEAAFRAQAQDQAERDLENRVARDVTVAWLDARYKLGLSSIVELTQAQLNKTRAEIEQAGARYEYQIRTFALRYETGELR
jgi:outer membrane protein